MSNSPLDLTIIVINYNTPELTHELVRTVARHTKRVRYEIVVLDNNSRPDRKYTPFATGPHQRVFHLSRNVGFARAANLGASVSQAPFLLFANSDCLLQRDVLAEMVQFLRGNPDCSACSPRLLFPDGSTQHSARRFPTYRNIRYSRGSLFPFSGDEYTLAPGEARTVVEAVSATFLMVKRDFFEEVGRFDETYFMYGEDTDLCKRLTAAGSKIYYLGDLEVVHYWGRSSSSQPLRMKFEHHRAMRRYFLSHYRGCTFSNRFLDVQLGVNLIASAFSIAFLRRKV